MNNIFYDFGAVTLVTAQKKKRTFYFLGTREEYVRGVAETHTYTNLSNITE